MHKPILIENDIQSDKNHEVNAIFFIDQQYQRDSSIRGQHIYILLLSCFLA